MSTPMDPYRTASVAATELERRLGRHDVAIVLGSGWADAASLSGTVLGELRPEELTGAAAPAVEGHRGIVRSVQVERPDGDPIRVLLLAGRVHLYEGHPPSTVVHMVRTAVLSGCTTVVLTNAAGSLRPDVGPGACVVISDQLNLTGANPMAGPTLPPDVPNRFVDLTDLYDAGVRARLAELRPDLVEGVYAGLLGGSFETPAEIRMLATLGADLVGMSTVMEAVAAKHLGARVVGISLVTNLAAGLQATVDHLEVLDVGDRATASLAAVLADVLSVV